MFIDSRTQASRPAGVKVRWLQYWRHDRQPWILAVIAASLGGWLCSSSNLWFGLTILVIVAVVLFIHIRYIGQRFTRGMLCPSITLTTKPMLVATLTDLSSGQGTSRPVVKVFSAPSSLPDLPPNTRVASVTLYSGQTEALHWNDCHPVLARTANDSAASEISLLSRIPAEEWVQLTNAIQNLQRPFKMGLFRIHPLQEF